MYGVAGDKATDLDQIGRFLFNFGNPSVTHVGVDMLICGRHIQTHRSFEDITIMMLIIYIYIYIYIYKGTVHV